MKGLNKAFLIGWMILGGIAVFACFLVYFSSMDVCAYHPPENREPGFIFNIFFDIINGHPEANLNVLLFCLIGGTLFGSFVYFLVRMK